VRIVNPPGWPRPRGYANGIVAEGRFLFISGQVAWDEKEQFHSDDLVEQVRQALKNTLALLQAGGAKPGHVARMTWYITDKREYVRRGKEIGAVYRELMGQHYPAMSMVQVAALMEDRAQVEIEVTAVIPEGGPDAA
jgi:enamine deaminase RidA (YjgF/YER057c/UK114 family)